MEHHRYVSVGHIPSPCYSLPRKEDHKYWHPSEIITHGSPYCHGENQQKTQGEQDMQLWWL